MPDFFFGHIFDVTTIYIDSYFCVFSNVKVLFEVFWNGCQSPPGLLWASSATAFLFLSFVVYYFFISFSLLSHGIAIINFWLVFLLNYSCIWHIM